MGKMTTDIETIRNADWDRVEREVVEKIHALRDLSKGLKPSPLNDKIAQDLILPALTLLGHFCTSVSVKYDPA